MFFLILNIRKKEINGENNLFQKGTMSRASSYLKEKHIASRPVSIRIAGYQGWVVQKYDTAEFRDCLKIFLTSQLKSQTVLKSSKDSEVYCLGHDAGEIYIKRYHFNRLKQYFQTMLNVNKTQKSWRIGMILLAKGIHTPLPILCVKKKKSFKKRKAKNKAFEKTIRILKVF